MDSCPFCNVNKRNILLRNEFCFAIFDNCPVSEGHTLIIPFRHFDNYFDATKEEKIAIMELIEKTKIFLDEKFSPHGYNLGVNIGVCSGQTIMHVHYHVIPRYTGDMEEPKGGVRGVIPEKRIY